MDSICPDCGSKGRDIAKIGASGDELLRRCLVCGLPFSEPKGKEAQDSTLVCSECGCKSHVDPCMACRKRQRAALEGFETWRYQ